MIMIIWISVIAINVVIIWSLISSSSCSKSQQTQPSIFPKPSRLCSCLHIVGTIFALAYISGCFVIVQYDLISWYFIMIITIIIINMKKNISPHLLLLKSHHAELVKRPKYTFLLPPLAPQGLDADDAGHLAKVIWICFYLSSLSKAHRAEGCKEPDIGSRLWQSSTGQSATIVAVIAIFTNWLDRVSHWDNMHLPGYPNQMLERGVKGELF